MSRQTAYIPLQTIGRASNDNIGGFCKFWYTPIENVNYYPSSNDPTTQMLEAEPLVREGTQWYGPIDIPDKTFGWTEELQRSTAGVFYKHKITGFVPGLNALNHVNFQNLAFHRFLVVCKPRSGGYFYFIGEESTGLELTLTNLTGEGAAGEPGTKFEFTGETVDSALVLPSFFSQSSAIPVFDENSGLGSTDDNTGGNTTGGGTGGNTGGTTGNAGGTSGGTTVIGDNIHDLSITASGTEGHSIYVPGLTGKQVIFLARESVIMKQVVSNPNTKQYTVNAAGNTFSFKVQIDPEEEFKFLYKD